MGLAYYADEARQDSASTREMVLALEEQFKRLTLEKKLALEKQLPEPIRYGDGNSMTVINAFANPMRFPLEICGSQDVRFLYSTSSSVLKGKGRNSMIC